MFFRVLTFPAQLLYSFIISKVLTTAFMSIPCGCFPCNKGGRNNCFGEEVKKIGDVMTMAIR